jgi:hypothetical protein
VAQFFQARVREAVRDKQTQENHHENVQEEFLVPLLSLGFRANQSTDSQMDPTGWDFRDLWS